MKLIALGGGACNALSCYKQNYKHTDITVAYMNTASSALFISSYRGGIGDGKNSTQDDDEHTKMTKYENGDSILVIGTDVAHCFESGSDYEVGIRALESSKDKILPLLAEDKQVILIGCGGGGNGSNIGLLAAWAQQVGTEFRVIYTMPFAFEGKRKRVYAECCTKMLYDATEAASLKSGRPAEEYIYLIDCEDIKKRCEERGGKITLSNAFEKSDSEIAKQIERFYQEYKHK